MSAQTVQNQPLSIVINNLDAFRPDIYGHWRTFAVKTGPQRAFPGPPADTPDTPEEYR